MVGNVVRSDCLNELLEEATIRLQKGDLGFPKEVANELKIIGRYEPITRWTLGLGQSLKQYATQFNDLANIMEVIAGLGYEEGIEHPDGSEPSLAYAAASAYRIQTSGRGCCVVSEDTGLLPHRPSMEELCEAIGCSMVSTRQALLELGLGAHLV